MSRPARSVAGRGIGVGSSGVGKRGVERGAAGGASWKGGQTRCHRRNNSTNRCHRNRRDGSMGVFTRT